MSNEVKDTTSGNWLFGMIAVAAFTALAVFLANDETFQSLAQDFSGDEAKAIALVEEQVRSRLLAPSTAKFAPASQRKITRGPYDNQYNVSGWVDAQNAFGVPVRHKYDAKVQLGYGAKVFDLQMPEP